MTSPCLGLRCRVGYFPDTCIMHHPTPSAAADTESLPLRYVRRLDALAPRQVRDLLVPASAPDDTPAHQVHLAHRRAQELAAGLVHWAVIGTLVGPMSALVVRRAWPVLRAVKPGRLPRPVPASMCARMAADGSPAAFVAEFLEGDAWDFDVDVDAVQQRTGEPLLVAADQHGAACAAVFRVAEIAARAGILRANQHEIRREGEVRPRAWLMATVLSSSGGRSTSRPCCPNFGISSRNSTPRCARLISPGRGPLPAAHQPGVRDGAVCVWEGPVAD